MQVATIEAGIVTAVIQIWNIVYRFKHYSYWTDDGLVIIS